MVNNTMPVMLSVLRCKMIKSETGSVSINSPYEGIDWSSFGQYKAALHVHSTNSYGDVNAVVSLTQMIEHHYGRDYDILAVTEHNYTTVDWVNDMNGVTQERLNEITSGTGRSGRGMLRIPLTNEQSEIDGGREHLGSFFIDYNNKPGATLEETINTVQQMGGISIIT